MAGPAVNCVENAHSKGGLRALRKQFTAKAGGATEERDEILILFTRLSQHTSEKRAFEAFTSLEEGLAEGPASRTDKKAFVYSSVQTVDAPTDRNTRASQLSATSEEMLL